VTYAVIPAKSFQGAKQRLSALLQPHERQALARATLTDTLTACVHAPELEGVGVVTCDREVAAVAEALGAEVLWEAQAQGHTQAVAFGVRTCRERGVPTMLTIPGDVPLITPADVQAIIQVAQPPVPVILVPNRDDSGTNAMVLSPPDCLPLAFGEDSFQRHLRLAEAQHLAVAVRRLAHVALDLDTPEDLALFVARRTPCHSLQVLARLGVLDRLASFVAQRQIEGSDAPGL
jgi:2-phospho-L-lactate guanylyltransferase